MSINKNIQALESAYKAIESAEQRALDGPATKQEQTHQQVAQNHLKRLHGAAP